MTSCRTGVTSATSAVISDVAVNELLGAGFEQFTDVFSRRRTVQEVLPYFRELGVGGRQALEKINQNPIGVGLWYL